MIQKNMTLFSEIQNHDKNLNKRLNSLESKLKKKIDKLTLKNNQDFFKKEIEFKNIAKSNDLEFQKTLKIKISTIKKSFQERDTKIQLNKTKILRKISENIKRDFLKNV